MTPALRLSDLHNDYGKSHILQGVSLEVAPGEIVQARASLGPAVR